MMGWTKGLLLACSKEIHRGPKTSFCQDFPAPEQIAMANDVSAMPVVAGTWTVGEGVGGERERF